MIIIRKIVGHSMLPVLPPSTTVFGLKLLRRPKVGRVVIVRHEGKEKIKRIDQVKDNQIYVLGDHANGSTDSRHFGWIPKRRIVATVVWPRRLAKSKH